jgi:hypothetical protein
MSPDDAPLARSGMAGLEPAVGTAENYRRFARFEAAGRSPVFEALALEVAEDAGLLAFLDALPGARISDARCVALLRDAVYILPAAWLLFAGPGTELLASLE